MKFKSIELLNWGPYQKLEPLRLDTSDSAPITIVYGNNGRGKTSLFHAVFFALYGDDVDKFRPERYANWFRVMEKKPFEVKVTLKYESQGKDVTLTRGFSATPINVVTKEVLISDNFVQMKIGDGQVINERSVDSFIRRDLPKEIAKFFLFDGEELKNVLDSLSTNQSTARLSIKDGIESLLGSPSLRHLQNELERLSLELDKKIQSESKNFSVDQENQGKIARLEESIQNIEADISSSDKRMKELEDENDRLINELEQMSEAQQVAGELKVLTSNLLGVNVDIDEATTNLLQLTSAYWFLPLHEKISEKSREISSSLRQNNERKQKLSELRLEESQIRKSLHSSTCVTCGQGIRGDESLNSRLTVIEREIREIEVEPYGQISGSEFWLRLEKRSSANLNMLLEAEKSCKRLRFRKSEIEQEILKLETRLLGINREELADKVSRRDANKKTIDDLKRSIDDQREKLEKEKKLRNGLRSKISGAQDVNPKMKRKAIYLNQLGLLIEDTIKDYSHQIRQRVQETASQHYVTLMQNEDIVGLNISDEYQVWIEHRTLGSKPAGSFGQNLVFVYALIGALIDVSGNGSSWVIDTPIARLDEIKAPSMWRWIAKRQRQVIVLPHKNELTPKAARDYLSGRIGREYEIVPVADDAWSEIKVLSEEGRK